MPPRATLRPSISDTATPEPREPSAGARLGRATTRVTQRLHLLPEAARTGATLGAGAWRSLVAHLLWEQDVGGSNPLAPTILGIPLGDTPILQGASNRWRGHASSGRPRMLCNPGGRSSANGFSNTSRRPRAAPTR